MMKSAALVAMLTLSPIVALAQQAPPPGAVTHQGSSNGPATGTMTSKPMMSKKPMMTKKPMMSKSMKMKATPKPKM